MEGQILVIGTVVLICLIIVIICLSFIRKKEQKRYIDVANKLEVSKNQITSTPVFFMTLCINFLKALKSV